MFSKLDIIGNKRCLQRIQNDINTNGIGGLCLWISGNTGTGKSMIAEYLASTLDCTPYRPLCVSETETMDCVEKLRRCSQLQFFEKYSFFIFDEIDSAHPDIFKALKVVIDGIKRERKQGHCRSICCFTTAKDDSELTAGVRKHIDEVRTRCVHCTTDVTAQDIDNYYSSKGIPNITNYCDIISVRCAEQIFSERGRKTNVVASVATTNKQSLLSRIAILENR